MPVKITHNDDEKEVDFLFPDTWDLAQQLHMLEEWALSSNNKLLPGNYTADLGFHYRHEAFGGGGHLSSDVLKIMGQKGIDLYFS